MTNRSLRTHSSSRPQHPVTWRQSALRHAAGTLPLSAFWGLQGGLARGEQSSLAVLAQQGGVERQQGGGKNYTFEVIVVVLFLGLALFAVCRSSRRV